MIPFKGRLGIKQYIKDKPNKWGIKAFLLCDSQTAYCFRFEIDIARSSDFEGENLGLTSAVVLNLTKGMEYKGHIVYTDNFYTSELNAYTTCIVSQFSVDGTFDYSYRHHPFDYYSLVLQLDS
jgi:hypothetical protein